jgi:tRNA threonylcarbamoyladenosine biosynthesis protein TsaB
MRILAIETTDKIGSVAAMAGCNLLVELMLERTQRSAQSLPPAMQRLLEQVGWKPADVQLVAVSIGPGSFTGLRVGVTAAKVFAYAVGAEILGISTLEAIAANCGEDDRRLLPERPFGCFAQKMPATFSAGHESSQSDSVSVVIDAQRGDVVVQPFIRQAEGRFEAVGPEELVDADLWLARLQGSASNAGHTPPPEGTVASNSPVVTGPGLARLADRLPQGVEALEERFWHPRAALVAELAVRYHAQGRRDDLWKLVPRYYRRSAAEEKWDARMGQR